MKRMIFVLFLIVGVLASVLADASISTYGNTSASMPVSLDLSSSGSVVTEILKAGIRSKDLDASSSADAKAVADKTQSDFLTSSSFVKGSDSSFTSDSLYFFYFLQTAKEGVTITVSADENMKKTEATDTIPWTVGIKASGKGNTYPDGGDTVGGDYKKISGTTTATFTHTPSNSIASYASYQLYLNVDSDAYLDAPAGTYVGNITITVAGA